MQHFGRTAGGKDVDRVEISAGDLTVGLLTMGANLHSVRLAGVPYDLTLGSDHLPHYAKEMRYHGGIIGPVANRISGGRVRIGGMMHELERNQDRKHSLHSGRNSTHYQVWRLAEHGPASATFEIDLADGVCELPGNRTIRATFEVSAPANLRLTLTATTDDTTLMNLANHSYWNLDGSDRWEGHSLKIAADHILPITDEGLPTGEIAEVAGTEFDFRAPKLPAPGHPPLDNNFCTGEARGPLRDVLWLKGKSGLTMTMATTEPGLHVFDGRDAGRPGHQNYEGLAFEAQLWPDAPNHPDFPSILLRPGETYQQITEWRFGR
ncbi:MAG: galactose mutarotase [Rhodobacteraceae bacterium]|jgi:aldose 1-epimerase|nr:galactose mutarotase [Paracoccaceae bacterium]